MVTMSDIRELNVRTEPDFASQLSDLQNELWSLRQELRRFAITVNGHEAERNIDFAVTRACHDEHLGRYKFATPYVSEKRVLDIACGTGYGSHHILRFGGALEVLGADIDTD